MEYKNLELSLSENVKVVFFDVNNVLASFSSKKMYAQIASYACIEQDFVEDAFLKTGWGEAYEKGEIDSRTLFHKLPSCIQGKRGFSGWMETVSNVLEPNERLIPLIKQLRNEGLKLCVFSNICEIHFNYAFLHFPSLHLFDDYILSYEANMRKPEEKLYEFALEKQKATKNTSFFIEELEEYAQKARSHGFNSESYLDPTTLTEHLRKKGFLL